MLILLAATSNATVYAPLLLAQKVLSTDFLIILRLYPAAPYPAWLSWDGLL
jgi:hypothetical protein